MGQPRKRVRNYLHLSVRFFFSCLFSVCLTYCGVANSDSGVHIRSHSSTTSYPHRSLSCYSYYIYIPSPPRLSSLRCHYRPGYYLLSPIRFPSPSDTLFLFLFTLPLLLFALTLYTRREKYLTHR